ncbi:hypothetical protein GLP40_12345 [Nocardia sp. CT2-14]|uniref:DUF8020 domain-containing protein n=2 Tax=Nocardia aurantiaca TaxID=2675850 RepID=A0A6I3L133_9NOCA|nr:hypothetical protein [Nocardia aurantiaca]MTE13559.1 hypothetical protein [Nocardia aurantiaca]
MRIKKFAGTAVLASAALAAGTGIAGAAPGQADEGAVAYNATVTDESTTIVTDSGSLVVENGVFKVKAANGATLAGTELSFRVDDYVFPIAAEIKDRTATLTPQFDLAHAVYRPVALPYEDQAPFKTQYDREQAAWNRLVTTIGTGATIGTAVGGLAGAAIGCVIGGVVGGTLTGALTALFGGLPGAVGGCIGGVAVVGFLGTVIGQLFITAPITILAAAQYFTTINAPFTPVK